MTEILFKVNKVHSFFLNKSQSHTIELESRGFLKKSWFLCSSCYKIKAIITSLIEILDLPNFGHMTTFIILFDSGYTIFLMPS